MKLKVQIRWIACLTAIGIVSGCSQTMQTVNVVDVGKPQTMALATTSSYVSGLSLHIQGQIDDEAVVSASNWEPQKISGKVDFKVYHDWFVPKCDLQYRPISAKSGRLTVRYEFHGQHPQYQIRRVTLIQQSLERQSVPAYVQVHVFYQKPGDSVEHERVCRYHQAAESVVFDGCEDAR